MSDIPDPVMARLLADREKLNQGITSVVRAWASLETGLALILSKKSSADNYIEWDNFNGARRQSSVEKLPKSDGAKMVSVGAQSESPSWLLSGELSVPFASLP